MKEFWFFFPLKYLLRALGGIPVSRKPKTGKGKSLTQEIIERFDESKYLNLAVTPEGTRSAVTEWRTGFLYIAVGAKVPVQLGVIDYSKKIVIIEEEMIPTSNIENDLRTIRNYYSRFREAARYTDKFIIPEK